MKKVDTPNNSGMVEVAPEKPDSSKPSTPTPAQPYCAGVAEDAIVGLLERGCAKTSDWAMSDYTTHLELALADLEAKAKTIRQLLATGRSNGKSANSSHAASGQELLIPETLEAAAVRVQLKAENMWHRADLLVVKIESEGYEINKGRAVAHCSSQLNPPRSHVWEKKRERVQNRFLNCYRLKSEAYEYLKQGMALEEVKERFSPPATAE